MWKKITVVGIAMLASAILACKPPSVELNISSDPPGADVYINKAKIGATPLVHEVTFKKDPQGGYSKIIIEVKKECYKEDYKLYDKNESPNIRFILVPDKSDPKCNQPPEPPPPPEPEPPPPPPPPPRTP